MLSGLVGNGALPAEEALLEIHEKYNINKVVMKEKTCIKLRGTYGNWFRNETLSKKTFYLSDYRSRQWFRENKKIMEEANYPGNQFDWNDTSAASLGCQQITPLSYDKFCYIT